ncbi:MAG: hypothetical protein WD876_02380 [Candidatus Pacearchaeota archaeon]
MPTKNALEIKENIISILRRRGPSLPVHITKETGLSILFAGAFLSELVADKKIRFTDMKVGSSPVYFLNEHAPMLERFSQHLNSREKDAFNLLKEKRFLKDSEQSPVIRVALRAIKDFAIPFNFMGQTFWRYYTVPELEFQAENWQAKPNMEMSAESNPIEKAEEKLIKLKIHIPKKEEKHEEKKETEKGKKEETHPGVVKLEQKELDIFEKKKKEMLEKGTKLEKAKKSKIRKAGKKKSQKQDENFFNKVKEWVLKNSMEILDIQNFTKNELHLRVKKDGEEHLVVAHNKKRLSDLDIIKAHKKAKEAGLSYSILSFGDLQKKMGDIIDAVKSLSHIGKIE